VDGKLSVAFAVSLPTEAIPVDDTNVINQDVLLNIAEVASAAITAQTGANVDDVGRYTTSTSAKSSESDSNLALILSLTLIPAAIIISVAAGFG